MKRLFRLFCLTGLVLLTVHFRSAAQSNHVKQINQSFKSGDVAGIVRYMDNVVAVTMNNNHSTSSKAQAEMMLRDFFSKNEPQNFEAGHSGQNQETNSYFSIGHLTTSNGRFRVYILLKHRDDNYILQELRIEK